MTAPSPPSPVPAPESTIAFIGGGNMARSLIGGLIARGTDPATIRVAEPVAELRQALAGQFGVQVFDAAAEAVQGAGLWLFAVKPQVMRAVCQGLGFGGLAGQAAGGVDRRRGSPPPSSRAGWAARRRWCGPCPIRRPCWARA